MKYIITILISLILIPLARANELTSTNASSSQATGGDSKATTGSQNQVITVMVQPVKPVVIYIKRTVTKVKKVNQTNPNRIQVLMGASKTKQEINANSCGCIMSATRVYEPDVGIQYLRDFDSFTGSITATKNESIYLGAGFNW